MALGHDFWQDQRSTSSTRLMSIAQLGLLRPGDAPSAAAAVGDSTAASAAAFFGIPRRLFEYQPK